MLHLILSNNIAHCVPQRSGRSGSPVYVLCLEIQMLCFMPISPLLDLCLLRVSSLEPFSQQTKRSSLGCLSSVDKLQSMQRLRYLLVDCFGDVIYLRHCHIVNACISSA